MSLTNSQLFIKMRTDPSAKPIEICFWRPTRNHSSLKTSLFFICFKMNRKKLVELLLDYHPCFDPYIGTKYKPYRIVRDMVYEILRATNYRGCRTDWLSVSQHWDEIMKTRVNEPSYLRQVEKSMLPWIRMKTLPKGMCKKERQKWKIAFEQEYMEHLCNKTDTKN